MNKNWHRRQPKIDQQEEMQLWPKKKLVKTESKQEKEQNGKLSVESTVNCCPECQVGTSSKRRQMWIHQNTIEKK